MSLLGFHIRFFNYPSLLHLFEEIFIKEVYAFDSQQTSPFIVDCGSNIGLSVLYFKKKYPETKVLCFEPDKEIFSLLEWNITQNDLHHITLNNLAVGNQDGDRAFFQASNESDGSLSNSFFKGTIHHSCAMVQSVKLSSYISTSVALLKLDVEGAEGEIIHDLVKENKLTYFQCILLEYHSQCGITENRLTTLMEQNGFQCEGRRGDDDKKTDIVLSFKRDNEIILT